MARRRRDGHVALDEETLLATLREIRYALRVLSEQIDYMENDLMRLRLEIRRLREAVEGGYVRERTEARRKKGYSHSVKEILKVPLSPTEEEVLTLIISDPRYGEMGASEIARILNRSREHVARALKRLVEKGVLTRDTSTFPYRYYISKEVGELVVKSRNVII